MIDPANPDYTNTPASPKRPAFHYEPRDDVSPLVSIITPYYNLGPIFQETVLCIQRVSFTHWEWIIVDDGSTDPDSLAQLERLQATEPRARVIHQTNGGPGVARNRAVAEARGQYLLQLDGDDLVEPTFVEKALWVLETHPQFAACGAYDVTFGAKNYLWSHGFQDYEESIDDNRMTNHAVIRRDAWIKAGGYDESVSYQHADWDFWLNLAEVGLWGYTLEEYLVWYRMQARSLLAEVESDIRRAQNFRAWLHAKHRGLRRTFPRPAWSESTSVPQGTISEELPVTNRLAKPEGTKRILFIVPWLEIGGADKFNLDLIRGLSQRGYEFTVVTTARSNDPWKSLFAKLTPDIFCLRHFLKHADYPRFLNYLIESRQIDAILISNSEFAYLLTPYLRACHPHIAILDYNHLEEGEWRNGGYPAMSVELGNLLDLRITCTNHLKNWMVERGVAPDQIVVCYCGIDTAEWDPQPYDALSIRQRLGITADMPLLLFVGRIVEQKRPLVFLQVIKELAIHEPQFLALVVGSGPDLKGMRAFVTRHKLQRHVRFMGALSNAQTRELLAAGDVLLLPSQRDGLAIVLYECMAMKTVPVAAHVGGHAELVTPECGYLIPHGEEEVREYLKVLAQLLQDPQKRSLMGEKARERVVDHFDVQHMAGDMEAAFSRACELAALRDSAAPDLELARYSAYMAVEHIRKAEAGVLLNAERGRSSLVNRAQRWRARYLPIGSRRYERYKSFRKRVRRLVHLVRSTPRYVRTGKILAVPMYVKASVAARYTHRRAAPLNNQVGGTSEGPH